MTSNLNTSDSTANELETLLEALCEERLTSAQSQRLEQLVIDDAAARRRYVEYLDLHGTLLWNAGIGAASLPLMCETDEERQSCQSSAAISPLGNKATKYVGASNRETPIRRSRISRMAAPSLIAATLLIAVSIAGMVLHQMRDDATSPSDRDLSTLPEVDQDLEGVNSDHRSMPTQRQISPVDIASVSSNTKLPSDDNSAENVSTPDASANNSDRPLSTNDSSNANRFGSSGRIVSFIDAEIEAGWADTGVKPSEMASDSEWLRRVYLDIAGHIPPTDVTDEFLNDSRPTHRKREELVNRLLDDSAYVRNWTTIWTNLLIGRSLNANVNRPAMQKFFRDCFARNRPWNDVVFDLVSAEGAPQENGASAFLLAHVNPMNNDCSTASAITARVFLGTQLMCTRCHDHPYNNWKQNQFYEFTSFFQGTKITDEPVENDSTKQSVSVARLRDLPGESLIYYEDRRGLMKVARPKYDGMPVENDDEIRLRNELAKLMTDANRPQLARATVNRLWQHFLGRGFTFPVDDMGPHNTPTHPELLEGLATSFTESGYDMKQLIRWICLSDTYQRSSRFNETNRQDDPEAGHLPLFTRVYPKPMTAEQLYDSLVVATTPRNRGRISWAANEPLRDQWIQQFVTDMGTDENDESNNFEGTISLALLMMNSDLMNQALSLSNGTYLSELIRERNSNVEQRLRLLCLSALSREPTEKEMNLWRKVLLDRLADPQSGTDRELAMAQGFQDVFWAYLNSNEFVIVP